MTKDRRFAVDFDPDHFAREATRGQSFSPAEAFRHAFQTNLWGGADLLPEVVARAAAQARTGSSSRWP